MELNSRVTTTWNFCTIGGVIGCLIVLFLFNQKNDQILNLWASTTSIQVEPLSQLPQETSALSTPPTPTPTPNPSQDPNLNTPSPFESLNLNLTSLAPIPSVVSRPLKLPNSSPTNLAPIPSVNAQHLETLTNMTSSNFEPPIVNVGPKESKPLSNVTYVSGLEKRYDVGKRRKEVKKICNMFDGKWVYKPDSKPSYMASQCPFMEEKMSCQRNKRPDMDFEKWVWEANDCDIPLLNGTEMVEMFRNKRVIFVGDSLNRNMWESLCCILYSNIPNASSKARIDVVNAHRRTFLNVKDEYNFTVEFFWTPYLVEHNTTHPSGKKVLVLDKLSPNSEAWVGADIMIFNSGMHWIQMPPKKGWDLYEYNGKLIEKMPLHIAYKRGMKTWAKWVQNNVDPKKTTIFYRSISAEHLNKKRNQWCVGKTKPIMDESYVSSYPISLIRAIEDVIKGMRKSQVKYLNVTKLSRYRIDAHPAIFRYKDWPVRAKKDYQGLTGTADCGHWCLPGVPDTWNRMMYAYLYFDSF